MKTKTTTTVMNGSRISRLTDTQLRGEIRELAAEVRTWRPGSEMRKDHETELQHMRNELRSRTPPKKSYSFWIQEANEAGDNWHDSIGFSAGKTLLDAKRDLRSWRTSFPQRRCRLIIRTDEVLA